MEDLGSDIIGSWVAWGRVKKLSVVSKHVLYPSNSALHSGINNISLPTACVFASLTHERY
jgi:hypothetical protein